MYTMLLLLSGAVFSNQPWPERSFHSRDKFIIKDGGAQGTIHTVSATSLAAKCNGILEAGTSQLSCCTFPFFEAAPHHCSRRIEEQDEEAKAHGSLWGEWKKGNGVHLYTAQL